MSLTLSLGLWTQADVDFKLSAFTLQSCTSGFFSGFPRVPGSPVFSHGDLSEDGETNRTVENGGSEPLPPLVAAAAAVSPGLLCYVLL